VEKVPADTEPVTHMPRHRPELRPAKGCRQSLHDSHQILIHPWRWSFSRSLTGYASFQTQSHDLHRRLGIPHVSHRAVCHLQLLRRLELTTTEKTRSATSWGSRFISCPHTLNTIHPRRRSLRWTDLSRRRLVSILRRQNELTCTFHWGKRKPCQKSPSTNTATRCRRKTKSGLPGNSSSCGTHFKPKDFSAVANASSMPVPRVLTVDMQRFLCAGVRLSAMHKRSNTLAPLI